METLTAPPPAQAAEPRRFFAEPTLLRTGAMMLVIVLFTGAAFWRVWLGSLGEKRFDFVDWDDPKTIAANPDFNPPSVGSLLKYWKEPYLDLYIPVTYTVWTGVAAIAKLPVADERGIAVDPYPFHAANILSHILSALLVFAILRLLVAEEWAALLGALFFALHPVQVEPIAWVSGFKDALSGLFTLAAIWQYLLYATRREAGEEGAAWQVPYLLATIFFLLAMLAKPSALTVPIIVGIIDLFLLRRKWEDVSGPLWIWLLMSLAFLQVGRMAQRATPLDYIPPLFARPMLALVALAFHLYHLVFPVGLAADYSLSPERLLKMPLTYVVWIIPAAIIALCYYYRNRAGWAVVAAGVFGAAVLPVLGLLPFDFQYYSSVADRYLYVAMLGPSLLIAYLLSRYPKVPLAAAGITLVLVLGVLTYRQTEHWRDNERLFGHTLSVNPRSLVAHQMLGNAAARDNNTDSAIYHYKEALITKPNDPETEYNLANMLVKRESVAESLPHFENAVKNRTTDPRFHHNYGDALRRLNRLDEACEKYSTAAAVAQPGDPMLELSKTHLAQVQLEIAQRYATEQNWASAIPHYEAALKADPSNPEMIAAQTGLAEARRRMGSRTARP
ncbi:MAG TPA: tetratricopeptide repeat protein [Tepidisphaeraceae bacterium]|jgi:tetratricopeptide (TPR) repeat protein